MDYVDILKRAASLTIKHKALWPFGFFLAFFMGGGSISNLSSSSNWNTSSDDFSNIPMPPMPNIPEVDPTLIWVIGGIILTLCCLLTIVGIFVTVISRTAIIGMVYQIEDDGKTSVKDGWNIGFSQKGLNLFLINLMITVPMTIIYFILMLLAMSPLLLALAESEMMKFTGMALGILFLVLVIFFIFVFDLIVVAPIKEVSWRYCTIHEMSSMGSLTKSFALFQAKLKDIFIAVLILIGIGILWAFVHLFILLILMFIGAIVGGIPALIGYLITQKAMTAVIAGLPFLFLAILIPDLFITGLYLIFRSAFWTLFFQDLTYVKEASSEAKVYIENLVGDDDIPDIIEQF
ncbi:MAG: hypothetical protein B6242_08310 [Anaerolineaceae bacterium 4572_78]|nr:MAG: hypothetical protein B6242_08310 [Anaerolineaceae bacterium 4572_78]